MIAQLDPLYIKYRPLKAITRLISYSLFEGRPLTTRGRWINPLIFSLFKIAKRLPGIKEVKKPIFILGTGRSGTTVLGMCLSMHIDVGFLNEPKALWHEVHPEEDLIGSYSQGPAYYRLTAEDVDDRVIQTAQRLYSAYLSASFSSRVVDKYPELIFRVPFVQTIFPDARFLFLIRNGWDTCSSIDRWSQRLGMTVNETSHDWWGIDNRKWNLLVDQVASKEADLKNNIDNIRKINRQTDMAAIEWVLSMREGLRMINKYPDDVYQVKFEKLTSKPKETLEGIMEFCELPTDKIFFKYACNILSPVESRKTFNLNPTIENAFYKTMKILGY